MLQRLKRLSIKSKFKKALKKVISKMERFQKN